MTTENTVKAWLYPLSPIVFSALSLWMMAFFVIEQPVIILWFFIVIAPAVVIYFFTKTTNETVQDDTDLLDDSRQ
jgi:hypothetical protein